MKTTLFLLLSLVIFACESTPPSNKTSNSIALDSTYNPNKTQVLTSPTFTLTISFNERSKDSRGKNCRYTLIGNLLSRKITYSGRRPKKEPSEAPALILSDIRIEQLKAAQKALLLTESYHKEYSIAKSGLIIKHQAIFKQQELLINVLGGSEQQNDLFAKRLYRFELLLRYLLTGKEDSFEKMYLQPIKD